jgi:DNA polymerase III subunit epsilon
MREIVLDTETTGFDPLSGHRIVEIGCVELINHLPTGASFHKYVNPERDMPEEAFKVHGLSADFLSGHGVFETVADEFLAFIGADPLIIHNAEFDMRFINAEMVRLGRNPLPMSRSIDTVMMARKRFPGAQASLDALCRRFEIDNAHRTKHGALLDAELLAEVYLQLIGGRQPTMDLTVVRAATQGAVKLERQPRPARPHAPTEAEAAAHAGFVGKIKNALWLREPADEAKAG